MATEIGPDKQGSDRETAAGEGRESKRSAAGSAADAGGIEAGSGIQRNA